MATIEVGKRYLTREKNTVLIVERRVVNDSDNVPTTVLSGSFVAVRKGSENMLEAPNHLAKFTQEGKWIARPGHDQPVKSVHDLVEECHA